MNKTFSILAVIISAAALLTTLTRQGNKPHPADEHLLPPNAALEERIDRLEAKHQALEAAHRRLLERYAHSLESRAGVAALPGNNLETRLDDLAKKQAELEQLTKDLDKFGVIESIENELKRAYATLVDTNLPAWTRAKQADTLKRHGLFDEQAIKSMMELWNQTTDNNERSGILHALSGVAKTPEFRDQILASLNEEVRNDNPSPKFRYMAVEALQPMLPDPSVEQWLQYMAGHDPEPKLRDRAGTPLGNTGSAPGK